MNKTMVNKSRNNNLKYFFIIFDINKENICQQENFYNQKYILNFYRDISKYINSIRQKILNTKSYFNYKFNRFSAINFSKN